MVSWISHLICVAAFLVAGVYLLMNEHPTAGGFMLFAAMCCVPTSATKKTERA